jgi:hypothetical protein
MWEITTIYGKMSPNNYAEYLMSGFTDVWGYSNKNIIVKNTNQYTPCSFTVFAFKEINSALHIGVRANIYGTEWEGDNSKMLHWNNWDDAHELVCKMINIFLTEMGYKVQRNSDCAGTCRIH